MRELRDIFFLRLAAAFATRGTCIRRKVGAVAVNSRDHVLATAFNGVPSGFAHCADNHATECPGAFSRSGTDLDQCLAVHAEVNLLAQCHDVWAIATVYLTCSPCFSCVKALVTSGCQRLVFTEEYTHFHAKGVWLQAGRAWEHVELSPDLEKGSFW